MAQALRVTRRGVLSAAVAGALTCTAVGLGGWRVTPGPVLTPESPASGGSGSPRRPLHIPPLAASTVDAAGTRVFELTAQAGKTRFLDDGPATPTWGFNGTFGGPTLRAREGETVRVRVTNALDEVTTAHWHGMMLPALADGGPHQPIHPGDTWVAEWTITQPAATLWYHPHNHGTTEPHIFRGLAGMFLVDAHERDAAITEVLPHDYGVDDIPVILGDRSFAPDGSFDERRRGGSGMLGDTVLVNGTISPRFEASRRETRLRVLNASTARSYYLQLDRSNMLLVGTDSGLRPEPVEVGGVLLTPGERVELIVTLEPGQTATLRSLPHTLGLLRTTERASGSQDRFDLLEIHRPDSTDADDVAPLAERVAAIGAPLAAPFPIETEPDARRTITLQNNKLNHRVMNMKRIDEVVRLGDRERWFIINEHFLPHNLHIHNARFLVRSVDGELPRPEQQGWKDTVYTPPSRTVVVDVEYGEFTDPHLPYMYHCHLLRHEDAGMMGQFVVVEPGQTAGPIKSPITLGDHHGH